MLFANQVLICSMSAAHVSLTLSPLHTNGVLTADFEQVIVPVLLFLTLIGNSTLSSTFTLGLCCSIILVQWLLPLKKSMFQYVYFSLEYCVYT